MQLKREKNPDLWIVMHFLNWKFHVSATFAFDRDYTNRLKGASVVGNLMSCKLGDDSHSFVSHDEKEDYI